VAPDEAWAGFAAQLVSAATVLERPELDLDDQDRSEGRRFLGQLTRIALRSLEAPPDPLAPRFVAFGPPDVTYGIPNPDNLYQRAAVDPACTYRIRGRRNSVHFLSFGAQAPGVAARPGTASHLDGTHLSLDKDGSFEIVASAEPRDGSWLELTPKTRTIMVRQTFLDRSVEMAAELEIDCIGGARPTASQRTVPDAATQLGRAAQQVVSLAAFWADWVVAFSERADINEMFIVDDATHLAIGGDPEVRTPLGRWRLGPDEALVIELHPPVCDYWNVQLANIWSEPLDAAGPTWLNARSAVLDAAGGCRVVVAAHDPGVANWLDSGGHHQGLTTVRWVRAAHHPVPGCRVIPLTAVRSRAPGT
jgi:hypothetical protein